MAQPKVSILDRIRINHNSSRFLYYFNNLLICTFVTQNRHKSTNNVLSKQQPSTSYSVVNNKANV